MPPRSRSRRLVTAEHGYGSTVLVTQPWYAENMTESSYPGSCGVYHTKQNQYISYNRSDGYWWRNWPMPVPDIPPPDRLDWGALPSSTEFGLIQFFAELDDTLGMFALRFWRELSYGSFTWGVLPFVSEVRGLLEALNNRFTDLSDFSYEDSYSVNKNIRDWNFYPGFLANGNLNLRYHLTGRGDMSFQNPVSILLDQIGFQPNLATAWDLVPLSFVVDWLLPVGNFLDSLTGGGWVRTIYFNGWQTCKFTWSGTVSTDGRQPAFGSVPFSVEGFQRSGYSNVLIAQSQVDPPVLQVPSFTEIFNMIYLAGSRRGRYR